MSDAQITIFWGPEAQVRSSQPPLSCLYIDAAGMGNGASLTLMFGREVPLSEQVTVADRVLAGVQRWRDGIADAAARERTAEAELAEARAEIARLKGEPSDEAETGGAR
ncbi:hypothetical protein [Streptomyces olivaceus]|uniref:hypothetical protein n=1 Tax=Streptomyces olivaceus TaxID=47716 RepID=UPI0022EE6F70|nr:hypothetical protein [Streptomyces olivaceus]GHI91316.1 hypothetical protein TPA0905_07870 [Streptomyces olivaceus]